MSPELLDEILAHPEDDAPRRVYADVLAERGDPRGELIAVQCELALGNLREALVQRELDLLRVHGPQWIEELGLPADVFTAVRSDQPIEKARGAVVMFHRGFPDQLKLHGDQLTRVELRRSPLRRLVLEDPRAVFYLPPIPTLRALVVKNAPDGAVEQRSIGEVAPNLVELAFDHCAVDGVLLGGCDLAALRTLDIERGNVTNLGALADAPWLSHLRTLRLDDFYSEQFHRLITSRNWRALTDLYVHGYSFAPDDLAAIASSHVAQFLERLTLDLGYREATDPLIDAFARSRRLKKLQRFELHCRPEANLAPLERRWGKRFVHVP